MPGPDHARTRYEILPASAYKKKAENPKVAENSVAPGTPTIWLSRVSLGRSILSQCSSKVARELPTTT